MKQILIFLLAFLTGANAVYSLSAVNKNQEIDYLTDDVETLKFRINELTREIAVLKTQVMKITGPDWNYKKGDQSIKKNENYIEVKKNNISSGAKIKNAEPLKENSGSIKKNKKTEPLKKTNDFKLNAVYESRPNIGKPIIYNLLSNDLKTKKNVKLIVSFSEQMMFYQSGSSRNLSLISKKNKAKQFVFKAGGLNEKNLKLCFNAGNIGDLNASILIFEDSNGNDVKDGKEVFYLEEIFQTIGLEE